ncbi:MAG: SdiA-regulated domain-containing protein [Verrucomicrobia bacterium]|nr:SdiA-regulated domain-containing protein [Verrucomicrobiota bacterium]
MRPPFLLRRLSQIVLATLAACSFAADLSRPEGGPAVPVVTLQATQPNAAESGPVPGTFRFSRSGDTSAALTVFYSVATGAGRAANDGSDYLPILPGSVDLPAGQSFVDLTVTPVADTLLEGDETVALTLVPSAAYELGASVADTVTIDDRETQVDLSRYVRIGRYDLPEPTRTPAPSGSLLAQEVSAITYNPDTDTLFVVGDGGTSVVQVSKTGALIDSMTLAPGGSPQGTEFYDTEGLTYVGNGKFVLLEERYRQANLFTYVPNTTLTRAAVQTVKLGTTIGNIGLEGLCFDPLTGGFLCVKEKDPRSIFQTGIDFVAGTATNGSPSTVNSVDLFAPALAGVLDFSDVYALSNLPALQGKPAFSHLLIVSQESGQIVHLDRAGNVHSRLTIVADPGSPLSVPDMTNEGVTMDRQGRLYIVNENGGGDSSRPQLWVYAPSNAPNLPPTSVQLNNAVDAIPENTSTAAALKLADIVVGDDGLGVNTLTLTGPDAASLEIVGSALFLRAGTSLNATAKPTYTVNVVVDDLAVGATPDAISPAYTLHITAATGGTARLIISEVAPWSSGNSPLGADWFEVTNIGTAAADLSGWRVDDNSNNFVAAAALNGITTIAPGESVIFIETANLSTAAAAFRTLWFGANPPANLQIGSYSGAGLGLGTGGDAVNLFDSTGVRRASVVFGTSATGPFASFDNAAGLDGATISTLSVAGVNGAFVAAGDANEIGSPGTIGATGTVTISIQAISPTTAETGGAPGVFRVSRTGSTVGPLTFSYTFATGPGQASPNDYTPALPGTGTIPSGQSFVDLTVSAVYDQNVEGNESLTLTLGDTGSYDVGTPGSATVTIVDAPIVPPLQNWRFLYFGSTANSGAGADAGDFDGDGLPNLLEYALGLDPTAGAGANGVAALPYASRSETEALLSDRVALVFELKLPVPSDVTYVVQASGDLQTWTDLARKVGNGPWTWLDAVEPSRIVLLSLAASERVKVGDLVPADPAHPRRQLRLRVTNP